MIIGCIIFICFLKDKNPKMIIISGSLLLFLLSISDIILVTHINRLIGIDDFAFALLGDGL
jgi:hypothetical protein